MSEGIAGSIVCLKCDDGDPESAKVIIVERDGHPARLFAAAAWEVLTSGLEAGDLVLTAGTGESVAQLGSRTWDSVCDAEAILPADLYARQGKKLAVALDALKKLASDKWVMPEDVGGGQANEFTSRRELADEALYAIAELDL